MGASKRWGEVTCEKHGTLTTKGLTTKFVKTSIPNTKKERFNAGCPRCKEENKAKKRLESLSQK